MLSGDNPPVVKIPLGAVQGYWAKSVDGRQYAAFEGIPYAEKPIGNLRFEVCTNILCNNCLSRFLQSNHTSGHRQKI